MSRRSQTTPPSDREADSRYRIAHYGDTRYWGLYAGDHLLAVTVYRRGAQAVKEQRETLERRLAGQSQTVEGGASLSGQARP